MSAFIVYNVTRKHTRRTNPVQLEKIKEIYYTAAEARKALDLSDDKFQYWVKAGRIKRVQIPGRKQGVYLKREVDKLARRIEATIIAAEETKELEYRKATIEDLEEEYQLSHLIFGKGAHTVETRRALMEQNPDIDYHLYDREKLVAFINIIPFRHEAVMDFINARKIGSELDPKDVENFIPEKPLEVIIMDMETTPTVPPAKRTLYATQLLMGLAETLEEMGKEGIIIEKCYATSSTTTGINILNRAGFKIVVDLGKGRLAYALDIKDSKVKLLKGYIEALDQWRKKQNNTNDKRRTTYKTTEAI